MNIQRLKERLGCSDTLLLTPSKDINNSPTGWYRDWDHIRRMSILIHEDTIAAIEADENTNLRFSVNPRMGDLGRYYSVTITLIQNPHLLQPLNK